MNKSTPDEEKVIPYFDTNTPTYTERKELRAYMLRQHPEPGDPFPAAPVPKWNIPVSEDMDADAFVQTLIEIDRADFWRMAEKEGLRSDLLKEVGYEFTLLTDKTGCLAAKYLEKHLEGWPDSPKSIELMNKIYEASIRFSSVEGIIECAKKNDRVATCRENRILADLFEKMPDENEIRAYIDLDILRYFILSCKDDLKPKRTMVYSLYGSVLVGCKPYTSFVDNGGFRMIKHLRDAMHYTADKDGIQQLITVYRTFLNSNSFTLKSNIYKDERAVIGAGCTNTLIELIRNRLIKSVNKMVDAINEAKWKSYDRYTFETETFSSNYEPEDLDKDNSDLLNYLLSYLKSEDKLYTEIKDPKIFYYGAYSIIDWPEDWSETQKCIFLYRMAHLCGFDKIARDCNLSKGPDQRPIKDRIKNIIKGYTKKDKDRKLLRILLRDVYS